MMGTSFIRAMHLASASVAVTVGVVPATAQAQEQTYDINIPAQSLGDAIRSLGRTARQNIVFDGAIVRGKRSASVQGRLTPRQALTRMLGGTDLVMMNGSGGVLMVRKAGNVNFAAAEVAAEAEPTEIIVTAAKREQRLVDVPQSITVVSAADLRKLNATQFVDYANTIPGVQFTTQGAGLTTINLRGVTTGTDVSSTVAIYVDEVPYGSSSSFTSAAQLSLDPGLFEIERIELLRGPQGTLYGASSMGGLIKYVTKAPSFSEFSGNAQFGVSSIKHGSTGYNAGASVNVPIVSDKISLRAGGFYSRVGGYVDNITSAEPNVDRGEIYGGRADLLLKPSDELSVRLTAFGQNVHRDGSLYSDRTLSGAILSGPLDQAHPLAEGFQSKFRLASATVSYDFGPVSLTSISSLQTSNSVTTADASLLFAPLLQAIGLPVFATDLGGNIRTKKFAQEVRLASASGEALEWVVGGFYTHEDSRVFQLLRAYNADITVNPALNLLTASIPSKYEEYAGFADLTWHITDKFEVTGGARYAHNNQQFEQIGSGLLVGSAPKRRSKEGVWTYLANAKYSFGRNASVYARFATGYRPGGPNYLAVDPLSGVSLAPNTFDSDQLESYEVGVKAETADRTFGIDASAFFIRWDDMQILAAVNGLSVLANAGTAEIKGAEITATMRPSADFTVIGAFAYNDGYIAEDNVDLGARKGERLPNAAHFTGAVMADYVLSANTLSPRIGATLRFVGDRTASFDLSPGSPQYQLPDYISADLRAGLTLGRVDAQLYIHNLFDTRGQLSAMTSLATAGGPARVAIAQPRTIGLSVSTQF
jgi:iron complex outermembrane receptor protein